MVKKMQFLGQTLLKRAGNHWSTSNREPWSQVTVGEADDKTWFAFVHFRECHSLSATLCKTMEEAKRELKSRVLATKEDIDRLDLS